jgi:hypothetical protein
MLGFLSQSSVFWSHVLADGLLRKTEHHWKATPQCLGQSLMHHRVRMAINNVSALKTTSMQAVVFLRLISIFRSILTCLLAFSLSWVNDMETIRDNEAHRHYCTIWKQTGSRQAWKYPPKLRSLSIRLNCRTSPHGLRRAPSDVKTF